MIHTHTIIYKKHTHTPCLYLQKARKRSTPHTQQCANKLISKQNKELCNIKHKHTNSIHTCRKHARTTHHTHSSAPRSRYLNTTQSPASVLPYLCIILCVTKMAYFFWYVTQSTALHSVKKP